MADTLYSWSTTKTAAGFKFTITESTPRATPNAQGRYTDDRIVKTGTRPTRAQARGLAIKWVRYFKQQQRAAA